MCEFDIYALSKKGIRCFASRLSTVQHLVVHWYRRPQYLRTESVRKHEQKHGYQRRTLTVWTHVPASSIHSLFGMIALRAAVLFSLACGRLLFLTPPTPYEPDAGAAGRSSEEADSETYCCCCGRESGPVLMSDPVCGLANTGSSYLRIGENSTAQAGEGPASPLVGDVSWRSERI